MFKSCYFFTHERHAERPLHRLLALGCLLQKRIEKIIPPGGGGMFNPTAYVTGAGGLSPMATSVRDGMLAAFAAYGGGGTGVGSGAG